MCHRRSQHICPCCRPLQGPSKPRAPATHPLCTRGFPGISPAPQRVETLSPLDRYRNQGSQRCNHLPKTQAGESGFKFRSPHPGTPITHSKWFEDGGVPNGVFLVLGPVEAGGTLPCVKHCSEFCGISCNPPHSRKCRRREAGYIAKVTRVGRRTSRPQTTRKCIHEPYYVQPCLGD